MDLTTRAIDGCGIYCDAQAIIVEAVMWLALGVAVALILAEVTRRHRRKRPHAARSPNGQQYLLSEDEDGQWWLHHAEGKQAVNGLAGAMNLARRWEMLGLDP